MVEALLFVLIIIAAVTAALLIVLIRRPQAAIDLDPLFSRLDQIEKLQSHAESATREEASRLLAASTSGAKDLREELRANLTSGLATLSSAQGQRLNDFTQRLDALTISNNDAAAKLRADLNASAKALKDDVTVQVQAFREASVQSVGTLAVQVSTNLKSFADELTKLTTAIDQRFETLRAAVDARLTQIQTDNAAKLEQMRQTVDEKLQATLNERLSASFKQVSDRLEMVHKGLGEMQALSDGVTDLKRVMTNVKSRGTWAEYQLANLLQDILAPDQYQANFKPKERAGAIVEFAVKLPGKDDDGRDCPCWLPIDSKFPREDYERLTAAAEAADAALVEECSRALEAGIKKSARDIREYINPPRTTEWAVLFLPTEGLYAEVLRRPGLVDQLGREFRVNVAGPTTLAAYLNALQMGFRSLAVQKKSAEIGKLLSQVKTQFATFGDNLAAVRKKLEEATRKLDETDVTTRRISSSLDKVQELPGIASEPKLITAPTALLDPIPDSIAS
jgi:DNA recombination protein RmuC